MIVDEALVIVEAVLDYERLNDVQEVVFRQAWEGLSYREMAKSTGYAEDYLKDAGAKLWQMLTNAFGEKVKKGNLKSVLKRYLRRHQIIVHRNKVTGVNVIGTNFDSTRVVGNLYESNFCQADLYKEQSYEKSEKQTNAESEQELNYQSLTYSWNGWQFRSQAEVNIAEALDRADVLFFPNAKARLTTPDGKQNPSPHFLVCYKTKLGILAVDVDDRDRETNMDFLLQSQGICIVQHYDITECTEKPDLVVIEFLELLMQA
ncbi:hypothetical protein B9T07_03940 [Limnospira fusiformis CCALA 023]|uniref:vWA-MoxR associated protein N-terminal HTH domain-containing protein n=1 Tax=Limnospira platensis NIES-46 TaxID=1236695 RepID=A0A5M3T779_LIMPL|nr:hypothetical protein [Arthrospira platensis]MDF2209300.1 hypothetical protein [Arthrospira platensis NCB002]BDT12346.1 hypothetical protein N39L_20690 [Arthrospira platensis NIES-39]GCE94707.1 hypothetical protein NIES46_27660 [Arthrospira platensis NIES-46]